MPTWAVVNNPVDVEPLFEVVGPEESVRIAVAAASEDSNVDSILVLFVAVPRLIPIFNAKNIVPRSARAEQKTMLTQFIGFKETVDSWTTQLEEENIPVYSSIERCVEALGYLWKYELYQKRRM
jgi:acyl-CoA synthetase (NDP forming)